MGKITSLLLFGAMALMLVAPTSRAQEAYNWSGFYLGVHASYDWSQTTSFGTNTVTGASSPSATTNDSTPSAGLQAGYDYMFPSHLVFGAVAGVSLVDSTTTSSSSSLDGTNVVTGHGDTDWSGTVRARLGYALDSALVYGTAGWAWTTGSTTRIQNAGTTGNATPGTSETVSTIHSGWTLGGGLELAFAQNWSVFGEYRYTEYGSLTTLFPIAQRSTTSSTTSNGVTFGLNYRF